MDNCQFSGKPLDECTCNYCSATKCPYLIKEQCPAKLMIDRIHRNKPISAMINELEFIDRL